MKPNDLLAACKSVMRPDGHYVACPCPGDYGHEHMPNNPTVAICEKLRAAIARHEGLEAKWGGDMMFLKVTIRNNGYGCQCCGREYPEHEWVDELLPFEEMLRMAHESNAYDDGVSAIWYEKDAVILYGFEFRLHRACADAFVIINGERYSVTNDACGCEYNQQWLTDGQLEEICDAYIRPPGSNRKEMNGETE